MQLSAQSHTRIIKSQVRSGGGWHATEHWPLWAVDGCGGIALCEPRMTSLIKRQAFEGPWRTVWPVADLQRAQSSTDVRADPFIVL